MSLKQHLGLSEEPLYLIDGSAFVFRGFYAFRDMTRSDGFPTNALFVIMRMMLKILREEQPTHLAFFLDGKGKNFRNDLFPEYKAQRPPTPEDLVAQLAPIREGLQHMGVPVHVSDGNEADDCIASLAHRYKKQCPVIIVGADKDLKQCIDTNVWLWDPAGKSEKLTGLEDFREETGLEPSQWADYQALIGDSSDNIPGVPGIGPKSAMQIMDKFKTVEDVWDNLDDILPKFVKKLDGHRENALLYRQLTTLQIDSCIELTLQNMAYSGADYSRLRGFIQEYEFRSLLRELPAPPAGQEAPSKAVRVEEKAAGQHSLFSAPVEAPSPKGKPVHETSKLDSLPAPEMAEIGLTMEDKGVRIGMNGEEWAWQGDK